MTPTAEQQRAIDLDAKQILCIAGAGSGKTLTLIQRILRLIRSGVEPDDIAAVVYTNEAARIIHNRLHPESGEFAINLGFVGTLHSFCLRHLQEYAGMENVTVLDKEESDAELLRCARAAGVKASEKDLQARRQYWGVRQFDSQRDAIHIAVASYYRQMEANRTLDFNAILTKTAEHLRAHPDQRRYWEHLLVDEYQDASREDFAIYMAVCAENRFFVGDPDQAIFGWRGGDIHGILACAASPDWEKVFLEGNFRSGPEVCKAAQRLIEHDLKRVPKATISLADIESSVGSQSYESDIAEAVSIAGAVGASIAAGTDAGEIAVLARTNAIADQAAGTLEAHKIPVRRRVRPDLPHDWRLAKAALRMLQAKSDDSILRFLKARGPLIGGMDAEQARRESDAGRMNLRDAFLTGLECTIEGVERDLVRLSIGYESRERVGKLLEELPEPTMPDLLLMATQEHDYEERGEGVTCTTIHGAKGREWEIVVLAGFEEETIPGTRFDDIEEERRLAYVGMTRAKKTLRVTWAQARRNNWGRRDYRDMTPSRFIAEAGLTI